MADPRIQALFAGPNFAHVATTMPNGAPHVAPVWIGLDADGRPRFVKEESAVAMGNLRRDPRLAISIVNVEDPYEEAHARGRAVEIRGHEEAAAFLRECAEAYIGSPYPRDVSPSLALIVVEIEHAGFSHFTYLEHTPPGARVQLPRPATRG